MDTFIYQYAVGGLIFVVGMIYAARQGFIGLSGRGLKRSLLLVGGLAFFAGLQAYLQYAPMGTAEAVTSEAEGVRPEVLGTGLDYGIMVGYFLVILAVGTYFGRRQKTIKDFFFGGQRFSWWLISCSMIATLIGSYSFVKYSRVAYEHGICSSQTYLNDWFWMPLLIFGWLPIFYFSRLTSVPEYFERRFGPVVRLCATILILCYLIGYVGVNLFTMGKALNALVGWNVLTAAVVVACVSAAYVTVGGQTSVIMTDLFQGIMLLTVGLLILVLGVQYMGGLGEFWEHLPRGHRTAFPHFNADPSFSGVGIFWQDAMANSVMFYFLNQGILMRFLAAKSVADGRKAAIFVMLVLMPIAACVVASGGWVARALVHSGTLPAMEADEAFFVAADFLSRPGVFGLVVAALTAALMSTVDTLITAVSAIVVNDVYRPYVRPHAAERELLTVARCCAVGVTIFGIVLVPVFMQFKSIYAAHGAFTAAITPPLVVTLLCSVFWKRFTRKAAICTMVGGMLAITASFFWPELISPFAHGVEMGARGKGFFGGIQQFKFMRAMYGLITCGGIAVLVTLFTRPESKERCRGLTWGTVSDALKHYKGSAGEERKVTRSLAGVRRLEAEMGVAESGLPKVRMSVGLASALEAVVGDLVYVSDKRRWLGGLHSSHAIVDEVVAGGENDKWVALGEDAYESVVVSSRGGEDVCVERLY